MTKATWPCLQVSEFSAGASFKQHPPRVCPKSENSSSRKDEQKHNARLCTRGGFTAQCKRTMHGHGKMLFQLTRNKGFKCGCLDVIKWGCCRRSTRFAPLVSDDQVFPFLRSCGKILQFASIWNQDLSRKSSSECPNDGPTVSTLLDLVQLLEQYRNFHFLSMPEVQHELTRAHRPKHEKTTQRSHWMIPVQVSHRIPLSTVAAHLRWETA